MNLIINGNDYHYAIEQLIRVFTPDIQLNKLYNCEIPDGDYVFCQSEVRGGTVSVTVKVHFHDYEKTTSDFLEGENAYKAGELRACQLLYAFFCEYFEYTPDWGIQTGVRPTKIYFNLLRNNTAEQAVKYLQNELFISPQKTHLVEEVCSHELPIIRSGTAEDFSLYISIPFCPTRCSYCSFISHAYDSIKKLIPEYVRLLCEEIRRIADCTNELNLHLRTIYIGGGTPTVLSEQQLSAIFDTINACFDLSHLTEFTLEAGRPDTLSEQKLQLIHASAVTRITVNAQSFNNEVLINIGRNHTALDVINAYALARENGFHNINTDLIAGLEGESVDSFLKSVKTAIDLQAENITIHTLALKRSSFLVTRDNTKSRTVATTSQMIRGATALLEQSGYIPYYMYRQSKSVGNLENTGWAKPGYECEYNIFMMEEIHPVFGAGAGAVTRLVNHDASDIRRVFNYKYPYEYIERFSTVLERKNEAKIILENWRKS